MELHWGRISSVSRVRVREYLPTSLSHSLSLSLSHSLCDSYSLHTLFTLGPLSRRFPMSVLSDCCVPFQKLLFVGCRALLLSGIPVSTVTDGEAHWVSIWVTSVMVVKLRGEFLHTCHSATLRAPSCLPVLERTPCRLPYHTLTFYSESTPAINDQMLNGALPLEW